MLRFAGSVVLVCFLTMPVFDWCSYWGRPQARNYVVFRPLRGDFWEQVA